MIISNLDSYYFLRKKRNTFWFTLVELIIVISILIVLASISYLYLSDYLKYARDSKRLTIVRNLEKWLQWFQIKSGSYPKPDDYFVIEANGSPIWYQWYVWAWVSKIIQVNKVPTDPSLDEFFIYGTNQNQTTYQILSYMEENLLP